MQMPSTNRTRAVVSVASMILLTKHACAAGWQRLANSHDYAVTDDAIACMGDGIMVSDGVIMGDGTVQAMSATIYGDNTRYMK